MLTHLILDNFKAFGTRRVIPLAPITLIFGANSAGKSSILQSLLLLKQTLAQAASSETLLVPKGDLVDLGSFRQMVYRHEVDRVCEITPMISLKGNSLDVHSGLRPYWLNPSECCGLGIRFGYDSSRKTFRLISMPNYLTRTDMPAYELLAEDAPSGRQGINVGRRGPGHTAGEYRRFVKVGGVMATHPCWTDLFGQFNRGFHGELADDLERMLDRYEHGSHSYFNAYGEERYKEVGEETTRDIIDSIRACLARLENYGFSEFIHDAERGNSSSPIALRNFLPDEASSSKPSSDSPEFAYRSWIDFHGNSDHLPEPNLIQESLNMGQALRKALDEMVYLGPRREIPERHYMFSGNAPREAGKSGRALPDLLYSRSELIGETNEQLKAFQVGYQLEVRQMTDVPGEGLFALQLVDEQTGARVGVMDVGFGVWQVLPVIVESLTARGTTVLIEEPEIHLHPRLQADLGNLFMRGIADPRRNQFIIETHSEHLILRLQRLIRQGQLKNSDVSVVYVMKGEEGSVCYPLRLDEEGDFIDDWPGGFFEEGFRERFS